MKPRIVLYESGTGLCVYIQTNMKWYCRTLDKIRFVMYVVYSERVPTGDCSLLPVLAVLCNLFILLTAESRDGFVN